MVDENALKRERGHYSAILTEQAWSIKDLVLYGIKNTKKVISEEISLAAHSA